MTRARANKLTIVAAILALATVAYAGAVKGKVKWFNEKKGEMASQLGHELTHVAQQQAGLALDESNIAYAGANDELIVSRAVEGVGALMPQDFAHGVDTLFIFQSIAGRKIPAGFYTVRFYLAPGAREGRAELIDLQGKVVSTLPISVENDAPPPNAKVKITKLSIGWGKDGPYIDIEIIITKDRMMHILLPIPMSAIDPAP